MTAASASVVASSSSSATFITALKTGVSDLIKATGAVTQTADTGQINWAGTFTPTGNSAGGYEMFALADALQATAPVYIKVEYGWTASVTYPQVWVTIGTGTNGAGTLSGTVSARLAALAPASWAGAGTAHAVYANGSAADAALTWVGWLGGTSYNITQAGGGLFVVERSRDFSGAPAGVGAWLQVGPCSSGSNGAWDSIRHASATLTPGSTSGRSGGTVLLNHGLMTRTTGIIGSDTYFLPFFTGLYGTAVGGPSKYLAAAWETDAPSGTQVPLSVYGASKTFLFGGSQFLSYDIANATAVCPCVRID